MAHRIVGQPLGRLDGADKVSGAARYSADVTLPGLVWGKRCAARCLTRASCTSTRRRRLPCPA